MRATILASNRMAQVTRRWKLRPGTKFVLITATVILAAYYGRELWADYQTRGSLPALGPGRVNLIAMAPDGGYKILVANDVAQLAEVPDTEFDAPVDRSESMGSNIKRIPIPDLLKSLQGDEAALSNLVMTVGDVGERNPPPDMAQFSVEQIRAALDGDPQARKALVRALNVELDGTPAPFLNRASLEYGVGIRYPVPVKVNVMGRPTTLTATVLLVYRPRLLVELRRRLVDKAITRQQEIGHYVTLAREVMQDSARKEDVRKSLEALIDPKRAAGYADRPQRLLANATVLITQNQIESAEVQEELGNDGRVRYNLALSLTGEGQRRLWKYSRSRTGFQLLLVSDGVAIAAPTIRHELSERSVVIERIPDRRLVMEAAKLINEHDSGGT